MKDTALKVAGVIFFLMAFVHLLRVILKVEITIGDMILPIWASAFGFVVLLLLALWMFKSVKAQK